AGVTALFVVLPALLTAFVVQAVAFSGVPDGLFRAAAHRQFRESYAAVLPEALLSLPKPIAAYVIGLRCVELEAAGGARLDYFLGRVSGTGFKLYFPAVLFGKLTASVVVAFLAVAIGLAAAFFRAP